MSQRSALAFLVLISLLVSLASCGKDAAPSATAKKATDEKKHDCDDTHGTPAGPPVDLGTAPCGPFTVKATRENFPIKAGCDAPIDIWVTGGTGKVSAVRFWVGVEDAKASIKARAEVENSAEPNHYHTHAEIPDPVPAGSKIWVEIEAEGGAKGVCSFALKN